MQMTREAAAKDRAQKMAEAVAIDLRIVLNDARGALEEFEAYVDSWDEQIDAQREDRVTHDPRELVEEYVVTRALEQLEAISHVHSGSTRAMHIRQARRRLVQLAASAVMH